MVDRATIAATAQTPLRATLNFAAARRTDYVFSNYRPEWRTLETTPHVMDMHDARQLASPPTLQREGFELHTLPVTDGRWQDNAWVQSHYYPLLQKLVLERTGGACALSFPGSWVFRDTGREDSAPAALYVHMDRERENCRALVRNHFDETVWRKYPRFEVINVWRPLTPPPQDYPLAFCDQRVVDPTDWIACQTREPTLTEEMKHLVTVHNPRQQWYYFPDMTPDQILVFRNYNDDPHGPQGCLHSAFHDTTAVNAVPRASFEFRLYVFFDA